MAFDVKRLLAELAAQPYSIRLEIELAAQPHSIRLEIELLKDSKRLIVFISGSEMNMWFEEYGYHSEHCPYSYEYSYLEHHDVENAWSYILEAVEKYRQGYLQCCSCGKWIPFDKVHTTCPAGCYCDDCYEEGKKAEREFMSMLD